ncbi:MAG: DUF4838 domain-containing protein [Chitinophagaceae bacterium]
MKQYVFISLFLYLFLLVAGCKAKGQILLVSEGKAQMNIIIPGKPTANEQKAATILQHYIKLITGVQPLIEKETGFRGEAGIYVGETYRGTKYYSKKLPPEALLIATDNNNMYLKGGSGKGIIYAVYTLLDTYFGCKKWANERPYIAVNPSLSIPKGIEDMQAPAMQFRQVYFPATIEDEFLDWHKLHRIDDLWGLWGHKMNKILPPEKYFATHPEYFALVNGKRNPAQPDFSNKEVLKITIDYLRKAFEQNPDAIYWSISINDDIRYTQTPEAQAIDNIEGGPTGTLLRFVNEVAKAFPDKQFTTLAYLYASKPPRVTSPANNVIPILSSIDAYRTKPLAIEPSAAAFRSHLEGWAAISKRVFVWDYYTQFTNYLAPFPDLHTLQPNIQYLQQHKVAGVFAQGSNDTYADAAPLKTYLLAKLLWNPNIDFEKEKNSFIEGYYGNAALAVKKYFNTLQNYFEKFGKQLDIYGNPVKDIKGFLRPEHIDVLSNYLDDAEASAEADKKIAQHVQQLRLSLEYTVLQQSKFFGLDKYGYLQWNADKEQYEVKPNWLQRVQKFVANCKAFNVKLLSEDGITPEQYEAAWIALLNKPYVTSKAINADIQLATPFEEDNVNKGKRTLIDGVEGDTDFSYNWLLFYRKAIEATLQFKENTYIKTVDIPMLHYPRHSIFCAASIMLYGSKNGKQFELIQTQVPNFNISSETKTGSIYRFSFKLNDSYKALKIVATPLEKNPDWLPYGKLITLAASEIAVY